MKGDRGEAFPRLWLMTPEFFGSVAVGVLRDFLDFVEPSSRPATAPLQPWWAAMVDAFKRLKLRLDPHVVTIDGRWDWMKRQTSASLLAIVRASGGDVDDIVRRLLDEGQARFSGRHQAFLATVPPGWKPT